MGIDPLEFRRRNSLRPGETKATGHVVKEWPFPGLCDALRPTYEEARRAAAAHTAMVSGAVSGWGRPPSASPCPATSRSRQSSLIRTTA